LLVAIALRDTIVFFHTPKEVAEKNIPAGKRIRLGGLVAEGSLKRGAGTTVEFTITDTVKTITVSYTGILPDLFREGQGVVAEGKLDAAGRFLADTVLAKHDENYTCAPKSPKPSKSKVCGRTPPSPPRTAPEMRCNPHPTCHPGIRASEYPGPSRVGSSVSDDPTPHQRSPPRRANARGVRPMLTLHRAPRRPSLTGRGWE
jgi:cytochrome c-type biogenesis protein CcmE